MYNAYIPGAGPYEKIPEGHPPGSDLSFGSQPGSPSPLSGLLGRLGKLDSGDLLLLLVLFLVLREGRQVDPILLLALAAAFLTEES